MGWLLIFSLSLSALAMPSQEALLYETDIHRIFGLDPGSPAGKKELDSAYRAILSRYHPDRMPGDTDALRVSKRINQLMSQLKKNGYDLKQVRVPPPEPRPPAEAARQEKKTADSVGDGTYTREDLTGRPKAQRAKQDHFTADEDRVRRAYSEHGPIPENSCEGWFSRNDFRI